MGAFAISKSGHDKGEYYVITAAENDTFVLVANGENRQTAAPKRKNIRHLWITNGRTAATSDQDIKRAIKVFRKESNGGQVK